jgi:hypothetical protein
MALALRTVGLGALLCTAPPMGYAGEWSGPLVDSKCYDAEQRNVNPTDTSIVDRDLKFDIRFCAPKPKTKFFAVVLEDFTSLKLDREGNAKAAQLVWNTTKKAVLVVAVSGERTRNTVKVASISVAR